MNQPVIVPSYIIANSLDELQKGGRENKERVVLWLGKRQDTILIVLELFVPRQEAEEDYFRIPRESMAELLMYLRENRLMIAAQVHSHPELAFHSQPDNKWAIVRHVGALSLVVPYFGFRTNEETFTRDAASFELSEHNEWLEIAHEDIPSRYRIES